VFTLLLPVMSAHARVHKSATWADSEFAAAEQMQEALEGKPLESRSRSDYEHVIDAYRRVYLGAPTSGRADPSVVAAAQMTEECQRLLARLPDESLRTVALWKMEGHTNVEIAARLGCVPQTVERKLRAIRNVWSDEAPT